MAQSVALHSAPVELEQELDPESDHYYGFDHSSASALASQHSDTLGASASDPPSDLGPPGPHAAGFAALEPKSLTSNTGTGHNYNQQQQQHQEEEEEDYGYETESDYVRHYDDDHHQQQHEEEDHHHQQSQQPTSWHAGSQLPPDHEAHQGQGQHSSQPYRPESGPVHASATPSPPPPPQHQPASVHNSRSNRSYSVAASLASVGSQSSIRRKPLSPTASPLAVRFSSKLNGNHMPLYDLQHPDSGYYSLDSPDLYDLSPNKQKHAPAPVSAPVSVPVPAANNPSAAPGQTPSLSPPLLEESDEDE